MNFRDNSIFRVGLAGGAVGVFAGIYALLRTQAYTAGFSGSDEPAHFLNAYLISTYIQNWLGTSPLKFAADFYIHYPKITIGHWPPAYYGLIGFLFLAVPATSQTAFLINLIVSALPSAGVAIALGRLTNYRIAMIGATVYSFTPLVWESQTFFMLDQALATCCIMATLAWLWFVKEPGWRSAFVFSMLCALAVLLKGNGWLLGLMPIYYILITSRYDLLLKKHLYVAAAVAALIVVPWYVATAGISADGFNYKAGWSYAYLALSTNIRAFRANLGVLSFSLVLIAIFVEFRNRKLDPVRWNYISACLSLILSTLTLQSLVPADIVDRYIAPALPPVIVLAMIGLSHCYTFVKSKFHFLTAWIVGILLIVTMLTPGLTHVVKRHPKPNYRMSEVAELLKKYPSPGVWLIDGSPNAEGAFIAEMAVRDQALANYVVRASKLFATSNFMGSNYLLKFGNEDQVLRELERLGVGVIVIANNNGHPGFPHSQQLINALQKPGANYVKKASFQFGASLGKTEVYESLSKVSPNIEAVRRDALPSKASKLVGSLD